jgi:oxygen-independent coproporphyrinogen-3 oxidase
MQFMADHFSTDRQVNQLHWGGGTPTFLSDEQIVELMDKTRQLFNLRDDDSGDYSIEIDPRECSPQTLITLREVGFNRISLGVQDVQQKVQEAVNRVQSTQETADLIKQAKELGFKSINIDLIYGLPHQSVESFAQTLSTVIDMSPDRLSIFNYAHMPDRFRSQRHINEDDLPSAAQKLAIQQQTISKLHAAGYQYIGMDHFAKPDDELSLAQNNGQLHRNFQGYTTHSDCDLVAMGVSAISQIGDLYYQNSHDLATYTQLVEAQSTAIFRGVSLTADDKVRRDLITQLICHFKLDTQGFAAKHQLNFNQYFAEEISEIEKLAADKLLSFNDGVIQITPAGRILVRRICMIFDAYMPKDKLKQTFSRII